MAVVSYQRILDGTELSGTFNESLRCVEKWQIRVDSPTTNKVEIAAAVNGVYWGVAHFEMSALKAMEFSLAPESKDGLRWILSVTYYIPPRPPAASGLPADLWEQTGSTVSVPAVKDKDNAMIVNSAGEPLETLERERDEVGWKLTKTYTTDALLAAAVAAYAGKVNSGTWAGYTEKKWKCYFLGARRRDISKFQGTDNAGTLGYVESSWEFRLEPDTWKLMPWNVGFMEKVSGERKTILGDDDKPVKQPVALEHSGVKRAVGQPPLIANNGNGFDLYQTANFTTGFGNPTLLTT